MSLLTTLERYRGERGADDDAPAPSRVDPRIDARRREVLDLRHRRRRRAALVVAVVATVLGVLYGVTRSAALDIDTITVAGASLTPAADVRRASGLHVGDHLVELDLDRAETQIRALPWIHVASVTRGWDGTIDITVTERVAVAAVHAPDGSWLIVDRDRRVLAQSPVALPEVPAIEGVPVAGVGQTVDGAAQPAIDVAAALSPGLRTRVVAVQGAHPDAIDLTIKPAAVIHWGRADQLDEKVRSLQALFAQADISNLCSVDIRVPDSPVLTRGAPCA